MELLLERYNKSNELLYSYIFICKKDGKDIIVTLKKDIYNPTGKAFHSNDTNVYLNKEHRINPNSTLWHGLSDWFKTKNEKIPCKVYGYYIIKPILPKKINKILSV